jgi:hypothetical protein
MYDEEYFNVELPMYSESYDITFPHMKRFISRNQSQDYESSTAFSDITINCGGCDNLFAQLRCSLQYRDMPVELRRVLSAVRFSKPDADYYMSQYGVNLLVGYFLYVTVSREDKFYLPRVSPNFHQELLIYLETATRFYETDVKFVVKQPDLSSDLTDELDILLACVRKWKLYMLKQLRQHDKTKEVKKAIRFIKSIPSDHTTQRPKMQCTIM